MSDYTPTTEVIRHALAFPRERLGEPRPIKPEAFDRWLNQVKADAWDEGAHAAWERSTPEVNGAHYRWRHEGEPRNPYREEAAQ